MVWCCVFTLFLTGFLYVFDYESRKRPTFDGDGWEYWYQAESFHRHGTPELLQDDVKRVNEEAFLQRVGQPSPEHYKFLLVPDSTGRTYGAHFWAYGLSSAPFQEYQTRTGRTPLCDLILANVCWYFLALGIALFASKAPIRERLAMICAAATGATFWYVEWTGAEIFSWAWTLISVVAYRDRRYALAGLAAGLGATQNPPIIVLGAVAALQAIREYRFRAARLAVLGTALGLIPFGFFYLHYGKPNLIATEVSMVGNISWLRTWSLIGDCNQGLLFYMPVLVLGLVVGFIRMAVLGNTRGLMLAAGGLAMAIGTQVAPNWNSSCQGLQRYLIWMIPVAAGVAIEGIGGRWRMWLFAVLAALSNIAIYFAFNETNALRGGNLRHTQLTEWILIHHPRAYIADPEVFIERQRHQDYWPMIPAEYPIAHVRPDGTVSKMILDAASVENVAVRFEVDPDYMKALRERAAHESGLFYAHPERGSVRVRSP